MSHYQPFKQQVLDTCQELARQGYLIGTGGNVSIRIEGEDALAITPSSRDYLTLTLDDICVYAFDKTPLEGELTPSIETGMHTAVYQNRPDVNAVIHTHQPFASILSIINKPIPALLEEITVEIGHVVDVIPYAFSGSPELVSNVIGQLGNACHCYLIQNHGALCLGADMPRALKNAELLENVAQIYYHALATGEEITKLPQSAIDYFADMRKLRFK